MDYREKYKKRLEEEEEQAKNNRLKRAEKKKASKLNFQLNEEKLKEHSSGLILWKRKENYQVWDGFINEEKCFTIKQGIYKYTLTTHLDAIDEKDKNFKTSFELNKLEIVAELIVKKNKII